MCILDRYLLRRLWPAYGASIAAIVAILSLENATRLAQAVEHASQPLALLGRMMGALIPEYLAIALPVSVYLATAATVRTLNLRGEWQVFSAVGLRPARIMLVPMAMALLACGIQLGLRLQLQPAGERALDAALDEIRDGHHLGSLPLGVVVATSPDTVFLAEHSSQPGEIEHVFIREGHIVVTAASGHVSRDSTDAITVLLRDGKQVTAEPGAAPKTLSFKFYRMLLGMDATRGRTVSAAEAMDRLTVGELVTLAGDNAVPAIRRGQATAAFAARLSSAVFCLLLPWLAFAFGTPPLRHSGGAALFAGLVVIVAFLKLSDFVERGFVDHAALAGGLHMAFWAAVMIAIYRYSLRRGPGAIDAGLVALGARMYRVCRP